MRNVLSRRGLGIYPSDGNSRKTIGRIILEPSEFARFFYTQKLMVKESQVEGLIMTVVDSEQAVMSEGISIDAVRKRETLTQAVFFALDVANISDQRLSLELDIDPATISKIRKGSRFFPPDKIARVMELAGNHIPLMWLADHAGFGLVRLQTEVEKENLRLREEVLTLSRRLEVVSDFINRK